MPEIRIVEQMPQRLLIGDTNRGKIIRERIADLEALIRAYEKGLIH